MTTQAQLPYPKLDALPLGAHRLMVLSDAELFKTCGVRLAFTGRMGGVSEGSFSQLNTGAHVGDVPDHVSENRRRILQAAEAADAALVVPNQVHGTQLVRIETAAELDKARERTREGVDGIVVDLVGVAALLNFADCLPLILVSPTGRFAVVHAGWRGAVAGIAGKAAKLLAQGKGECDPSCLNAYIGPHIRSECFEVGPDVEQSFCEAFGSQVVVGERHVSLAAAVTADLMDAGVLPERVADACICTKCHSHEYFSYRASGGVCGRHAAFAVRLPQ